MQTDIHNDLSFSFLHFTKDGWK